MTSQSMTQQDRTIRSNSGRLRDLRRTDGGDRLYFRSSRIAVRHNGVFVRTREGFELGPFDSVFAAEIEAELLVSALARLSASDDTVASVRAFLSAEHEQADTACAG